MAESKSRIKDIMTTGVITVSQEDPVKKAIDVMAEKNISCVVVTESKGSKQPVGLITERDLVRRVLRPGKDTKKLKAKNVMTTSLVSISEEASLEEGMRIIQSMRIRRLPVVNTSGVIGLITQTDIVNETYDIHQHNKRLMFHQNLQSYIILALAAFFVIVFLLRFYL